MKISTEKHKTAALEGGGWSVARPGRTLPPGKSRLMENCCMLKGTVDRRFVLKLDSSLLVDRNSLASAMTTQ